LTFWGGFSAAGVGGNLSDELSRGTSSKFRLDSSSSEIGGGSSRGGEVASAGTGAVSACGGGSGANAGGGETARAGGAGGTLAAVGAGTGAGAGAGADAAGAGVGA
jgi:hypothetical protein